MQLKHTLSHIHSIQTTVINSIVGNLPKSKKPSCTTGKCTVHMLANSVFKGVVGNAIEHVRDCTEGSPSREEGEEQVPSSERSLEIKGWTVSHDLLTEITEEKVSDDSDCWEDIVILCHPIEDRQGVEVSLEVRIEQ